MRVAMEEVVAVTAVSAVEATQVSAVALAATLELGSAEELVTIRQDLIHLEFQQGGMAVTAGPDKGPTHRERRSADRFIVLLRRCKTEPLPGSLLVHRVIPVATTSREINRWLALPENPTCNPDIIREQIAMAGSSAPLPQEQEHDLAAPGQSRI